MEVIIRQANDLFLEQVTFPAFELGVLDLGAGVEYLLRRIKDERSQLVLEELLGGGEGTSIFELEEPGWVELVYRLLFWDWVQVEGGWAPRAEQLGFAGDWEQVLHLSLLLEQSDYPYGQPEEARAYRAGALESPRDEGDLTRLLCGFWDPIPPFPPDQVLASHALRPKFRPDEGVVMADWAWRPRQVVQTFSAQLPSRLSRLLSREARRLAPVEVPETLEVLDYWMGRVDRPPTLSVCFSGLGPTAHEWIRDIGALCRHIRDAAYSKKGLTVMVTRAGRTMFDGGAGD